MPRTLRQCGHSTTTMVSACAWLYSDSKDQILPSQWGQTMGAGLSPPSGAYRNIVRLVNVGVRADGPIARIRVGLVVPKAGVEPARGCPQRFLRPPRLPFRHFGMRGGWSGRGDSNPRPSPWQGDALPLSHFRSQRSDRPLQGYLITSQAGLAPRPRPLSRVPGYAANLPLSCTMVLEARSNVVEETANVPQVVRRVRRA